MSWSVNFVGKPEAIAKEMEAYSSVLTGESKTEYDAALPHMTAILRQNFTWDESSYPLPIIRFNASGHGIHVLLADGQKQTFGQCSVSMETLYGKLLI